MIREIKPSELSLTRDCAFAFFRESNLDGILNFDHFCETWSRLIALDMAKILLYIDNNENAKGIIGGTITKCTMTADIIAMESFWWVAPELRGGVCGIKLLREWEKACMSAGAKRLYVGNLEQLNNEKMRCLYRRMGYRALETHYVKSI